MSTNLAQPAFGAADLSNCEREQIHLAGSIQPLGVLLVLSEPDLVVEQASINASALLEVEHHELIGRSIRSLDGNLFDVVQHTSRLNVLKQATPIRARVHAGDALRETEGWVHRLSHGELVVELQFGSHAPPVSSAGSASQLPALLADSISKIAAATSVPQLANVIVETVRSLTGYDRAMVYEFDDDGHGEVIAESREEYLEPFLGQHYPASDIPQRARELYLRTRVRVLADVDYTPVPVVPRVSVHTGDELDMSLCNLRSMSPLHLQYLRNMGVTATLVTSIVREGRLWGLIACHHYTPRAVAIELRSACELLSEVVSTRLSAIANHAQADAELLVRELEYRLVRSATETGDWRDALFATPDEHLLRPLAASGAVLFSRGEVLVAGETPGRSELRAIVAWLQSATRESVFHSSSFPRLNPETANEQGLATGILALELSREEGEYLIWFRKEQIRTVTWAGNPGKPVQVGNNPLDLSPRRSFAAWSELVRGTAKPWSTADVAIATAMRASLLDMILQMRALRALIAEKQAADALRFIEQATEPMILADADGDVLTVNHAFHKLAERPLPTIETIDHLVLLTREHQRARDIIAQLRNERRPWRGELRLIHAAGDIPVAMRADPVPGLRGNITGYILLFTDLRQMREVRAARIRLEKTIAESQGNAPAAGVAALLAQDFDKLLSAVLANANAAVVQISESSADGSTSELLRELETTTRRAAELTAQILGSVSRGQPPALD